MKQKFDAIIQPRQAEYLEKLHHRNSGVLSEIEALAHTNNIPITDREVALFLEINTRLLKATRVLEIGLAIGYGTAHIAAGLDEGGKVIGIEPSPEMINFAERFLTRLNLRDRVEIIQGRALDIIPNFTEKFDLIFLDAVKEEYVQYLAQALPHLKIGGAVIVDNLLWGGQVAGDIIGPDQESSTLALRNFNRVFVNHPQLRAQVLPFGDGVGFAVKIA